MQSMTMQGSSPACITLEPQQRRFSTTALLHLQLHGSLYRVQAQFDEAGKMPEDTTKTASLLNWISYCLVTNPRNQSVAAALTLEPHSKSAVIHLAANVLPPDAFSHSEALCDAINAALQSQLKHQNAGCTPDGLRQILDVALAGAYRRMTRKLQLILDVVFVSPLKQTMTLRGGEAPRATLSRVLKYWNNPATALSILEAYDNLSTLSSALLHHETRLKTWSEIMTHCATILSSEVMARIQSADIYSRLHRYDRSFLDKLQRRVWHLAYYQSGAENILTHIPNRWRKFLTDGWRIRFVWVPHTPPALISIPYDPVDDIMSLLRRRGYHPTREEVLSSYPAKVINCWRQGQTLECNMHPEAQLIGYLLGLSSFVSGNVLGGSKRPCDPCHSYGGGIMLNGESQTYQMTSVSGRHCTSWMVPSWTKLSAGGRKAIAELQMDMEGYIALIYKVHLQSVTKARDAI